LTSKISRSNILNKIINIGYLIYDYIVYCLHSNSNINNKPCIIYIGEYFPVRIQRLVKLIKNDFELEFVLYISKWGYEPKLIGNHFDRIEIYRNKYHLKTLLKHEAGVKLVHAFEPKAKYQYISKQSLKAPFIYDLQDIIITYFHFNPPYKWQKTNLIYEEKLLNEADAFISHSLELNEAFRLYNIKHNKPRLFFPLYCDTSNFKTITNKANKDNSYKLVYIGGLNSITDKNSANFLPFIKKLNHQNLNFTIYPSPFSERLFYNEYKSLEKQFKHFKMEHSVPFINLDLTPFHFGIVPFENEDIDQYYSKNKYASTLKFFVYLEMGLPIIVSEYWAFPAWICSRYQLGIVTSFDNLDRIDQLIEKIDYNQILKNIETFRQKYNLQNQSQRLKQFYQNLLT